SDGSSPAITSHSSSVKSPRAIATPAKSSFESDVSLSGNPLCQRGLVGGETIKAEIVHRKVNAIEAEAGHDDRPSHRTTITRTKHNVTSATVTIRGR
ncbi:hypothetical protein, partial [Novosphingobium chloroacetimidivorans]|uniref:hypothetical protein n=1 Tax=Novosphingobium chloroacetimidivorans TaxID=1428314 RepID=UPI001C886C3D